MKSKIGTPAFAAPEVYSGNPYSENVDIWGSGTVLYFMLSGAFPFNVDNLEELNSQI